MRPRGLKEINFNIDLVTVTTLDMCMTPNQRQGDKEAFLENVRKESLVFFLSKLNTSILQNQSYRRNHYLFLNH